RRCVPCAAERQLRGGGADQAGILRLVAVLPMRGVRRRCAEPERTAAESRGADRRVRRAVVLRGGRRGRRRYTAGRRVRGLLRGAINRGGNRKPYRRRSASRGSRRGVRGFGLYCE